MEADLLPDDESKLDNAIIDEEVHCSNRSDYSEELAKFQKTALALVFIVAFMGNVVVFCAVLSIRKGTKHSRMNTMITQLCCADLFVCFFNILPHMITISHKGILYGGALVCALIPYLQVMAMYASSYVLLVTSVDRYIAICHPLKSHSWYFPIQPTLVFIAWMCSLALSMPQSFVFASSEFNVTTSTNASGGTIGTQTINYCSFRIEDSDSRFGYAMYYATTIYFIPFVILTALNVRICHVVWQSMSSMSNQSKSRFRKLSKTTSDPGARKPIGVETEGSKVDVESCCNDQEGPRSHVRTVSRAKIKTIKLTVVLVVSYIVCWGPFFICSVWAAWDPCRFNEASADDRAMAVITMDLPSISSCVNPIVCLIFNANIRNRLFGGFRRFCSNSSSNHRTQSTSDAGSELSSPQTGASSFRSAISRRLTRNHSTVVDRNTPVKFDRHGARNSLEEIDIRSNPAHDPSMVTLNKTGPGMSYK